LGQNFAKASQITFQSKEGKEEFAWTTSWGVSSRLIGALIMTHSDDNGLVLPPRVAPAHVVFLPIYKTDEEREKALEYCEGIAEKIRSQKIWDRDVIVEVDNRDMNAGERQWDWVKRGIPVRVEVGPRDMKNNSVFVGRRDKGVREKYGQDKDEFASSIVEVLTDIQNGLLESATTLREENTKRIDDWQEFVSFFTAKNKKKPEIHGGWALSHWCGSAACENQPKDQLKVTIRCIPFAESEEEGRCVVCGAPSKKRVIFAKSY
jgi:prolyl-tRNA synthetase